MLANIFANILVILFSPVVFANIFHHLFCLGSFCRQGVLLLRSVFQGLRTSTHHLTSGAAIVALAMAKSFVRDNMAKGRVAKDRHGPGQGHGQAPVPRNIAKGQRLAGVLFVSVFQCFPAFFYFFVFLGLWGSWMSARSYDTVLQNIVGRMLNAT